MQYIRVDAKVFMDFRSPLWGIGVNRSLLLMRWLGLNISDGYDRMFTYKSYLFAFSVSFADYLAHYFAFPFQTFS